MINYDASYQYRGHFVVRHVEGFWSVRRTLTGEVLASFAAEQEAREFVDRGAAVRASGMKHLFSRGQRPTPSRVPSMPRLGLPEVTDE